MKRILYSLISLTVATPLATVFMLMSSTGVAHAAGYDPNYLIDDKIFQDAGSMSQNDVQNFLVSKNSGLKSVTDVEDCGSTGGAHYSFYATYYSCGQTVAASKIIHDAASAYGISPRVIIATLQKEQSLITTPNPTSSQINCAMGYNSCGKYVGFFSQVDNGTWQFKTYIERIDGRTYWGLAPSSYPCRNATSLYSAGLLTNNTVTFANPYYNGDPAGPGQGARTVHLNSASTAGLYCYTPYVGPYNETGYSGSYNFVIYFNSWFGSTINVCGNDPADNATAPGHVNGDYNANGHTDPSIFRPSDGCWHMRAYGDTAFGQSGDIPVPGDYNGDGRADIAVFHPGSGDWHIRAVGDFNGYGQSGDIPVPGDYNGDGKTEAAVYRPTQCVNGECAWHIRGVGDFYFGHPGDIPVPGDYNGDGKTDLAVFRPSTGDWHIRAVGDFNGYGQSGDIPVPGDYNGDGKTEAAVYRPTQCVNGECAWHIRGVGDFFYGHAGDIPVPGDYNGDGKTDIAVFRPSDGGWHMRAVGDLPYGQSGDVPVIQTLNALLLEQYGLITSY